MYSVACKELGFADCDFVAVGKHRRTVIDLLLAHARDEHPELIQGITEERHEEIVQVIETHITQTAV